MCGDDISLIPGWGMGHKFIIVGVPVQSFQLAVITSDGGEMSGQKNTVFILI